MTKLPKTIDKMVVTFVSGPRHSFYRWEDLENDLGVIFNEENIFLSAPLTKARYVFYLPQDSTELDGLKKEFSEFTFETLEQEIKDIFV